MPLTKLQSITAHSYPNKENLTKRPASDSRFGLGILFWPAEVFSIKIDRSGGELAARNTF